MELPLRCACGQIHGRLEEAEDARRALCYCKDCQAYARWIDRSGRLLDRAGGTEIIAVLPYRVHFDAGADRLLCVSLTPKGPLRWYASCCRTPIGNTSRQPGLPYVGLVAACVPALPADRDRVFGPIRVRLNTESASGRVEPAKGAVFTGLLRIMRKALGARLSGRYKRNPFFMAGSAEPLSPPETLGADERRALYAGL